MRMVPGTVCHSHILATNTDHPLCAACDSVHSRSASSGAMTGHALRISTLLIALMVGASSSAGRRITCAGMLFCGRTVRPRRASDVTAGARCS